METSMPRARNWPRNVSPVAFGKINLVNNLGYAMGRVKQKVRQPQTERRSPCIVNIYFNKYTHASYINALH